MSADLLDELLYLVVSIFLALVFALCAVGAVVKNKSLLAITVVLVGMATMRLFSAAWKRLKAFKERRKDG